MKMRYLALLPLLAAAVTEPVTVVTNSLLVIRAAADLPGLHPHLLGGTYDHDLEATFGTACTDSIARWRADVAVVSVPALRGRGAHQLGVRSDQVAARRGRDGDEPDDAHHHLDAAGRVLPQCCSQVLTLVVDRGVEAELL